MRKKWWSKGREEKEGYEGWRSTGIFTYDIGGAVSLLPQRHSAVTAAATLRAIHAMQPPLFAFETGKERGHGTPEKIVKSNQIQISVYRVQARSWNKYKITRLRQLNSSSLFHHFLPP
jgi:hypothetical protein